MPPSGSLLLSRAEHLGLKELLGTIAVSRHVAERPRGCRPCHEPCSPGVRVMLCPASPVQLRGLWGAAAVRSESGRDRAPTTCQPGARAGQPFSRDSPASPGAQDPGSVGKEVGRSLAAALSQSAVRRAGRRHLSRWKAVGRGCRAMRGVQASSPTRPPRRTFSGS